MRRWIFAAVALAFSLGSVQPADAQVTPLTPGQQQCQRIAAQTVLPALAAANAFGPAGVTPVGLPFAGFRPLDQPFGLYPGDQAVWGNPYGAIAAAAPAPVPPATAPDPRLSAAAILEMATADGTLAGLTPTERATFLRELANLQQTEIGNRINAVNAAMQAQVNQQNAMVNAVNIRRVPYDLASQYQERARNWRDSYSVYAQTTLNILGSICNPNNGAIPGGLTGGLAGAGLPALAGAGLPTLAGAGLLGFGLGGVAAGRSLIECVANPTLAGCAGIIGR